MPKSHDQLLGSAPADLWHVTWHVTPYDIEWTLIVVIASTVPSSFRLGGFHKHEPLWKELRPHLNILVIMKHT